MGVMRNEDNERVGGSVNGCVGEGRGELIGREDGEDICVGDGLEKEVELVESDGEYDVVGRGMRVFDEWGRKGVGGVI